MRRIWNKLVGVVVAGVSVFAPMMPVAVSSGAMAYSGVDSSAGSVVTVFGDDVQTSILPQGWANKPNGEGIMDVLKLVLTILVYGLGVLATLGVVIAGIMYMTARDNEQQVAKAKKRLIEIVIGLIAWALMYSVLNWLIPGGWSGLVS